MAELFSPHVSDNEEENPTLTINNSSVQPSEMFEKRTNEDIEAFNEEHWLHIIENWLNILNIENHLDSGKIISNELPEFEFELDECVIYPADDSLAKWNLLGLFNDLVEASISFIL